MVYSIGDIARLSGVTAFTLRYYEKIGLLPNPRRQEGRKDGVRQYSEEDLRFIRFIHSMKQTGMKLEDLASFTEDGCLLNLPEETDWKEMLQKRIELLDRHLDDLDHRMKQLQAGKEYAENKRAYYTNMLREQAVLHLPENGGIS
ncbi:MerR family transcriptional regulator [Paenibacillus aurantius]|uniref:MerR family transcriptional regulator n=1 Tax=Paenibacillus aurantius TaxID=2918900 RepID=A0AA96RFD3_9BACL|nr:MerR family transcriptional regulator [Paenibacillus aurantius]WNQ08819.1 MerR family transcriptional regulator [Paenibacillus aurantius]